MQFGGEEQGVVETRGKHTVASDREEAADAFEELGLVVGFAAGGGFAVYFFADHFEFHLAVGHDYRHIFSEVRHALHDVSRPDLSRR